MYNTSFAYFYKIILIINLNIKNKYYIILVMCQYKCYKCESLSSLYVKDIIRHWNSKKKCIRTENSLLYSHDQILLLSLFPENFINKSDIEKYQNSTLLYENQDRIFDLINGINLRKEKTCNLCNKSFHKKIDIKKHILFECFEESIHKDKKSTHIDSSINKNINTNIDINNSKNNTINNTYNDSNVTINHINNINIEIKCPIEINEEWDKSHIEFEKMNNILISNHLITKYLDEILKNDNNLNVILSEFDSEGLVYDEKKYVKMKKEDITDKTMNKIKNDLNIFLDDGTRKKEIVTKYLEDTKKRLEIKINDFNENKDGIKETVIGFICKIYHAKREKSIEICNQINSLEKKDGY